MKEERGKEAWRRVVTWLIWLLIFLVICGDVIRRPHSHTTTPTYRLASMQWWAGQDPYSYRNHDAFLYFPQAAILYTPFTWGPSLLGDLLWRAATFVLFAYAMVRLQAFFLRGPKRDRDRTFLFLTLLAVPSALASLRNAQFDLPLAALFILAAAEVGLARWNAAVFWLCLALALKPLALVPMLFFGALHFRTLAPRLAIGLLLTFALPFLHWNPSFVAHEYVRCAQTLAWATQADEARYSDLGALLSKVAMYPPYWLKTAARIVFALGYLGLGIGAVRRFDRAGAAWLVGALSADYLMLFNPRTETCSYVFLGPFLASAALACLSVPERRGLGWALVFGALACACDAFPGLGHLTDRWLKPLVALLFLPVLIEAVFGTKRTEFWTGLTRLTGLAEGEIRQEGQEEKGRLN
jgi:alpha-1,2-mannosyltransferase